MHAITRALVKGGEGRRVGAAKAKGVRQRSPLEDFNKGHPGSKLDVREELVKVMFSENAPDFGAASDGSVTVT